MSIKIEQLKKLPDEPGVYFFKRGKEILYIGKATSLRDRVRSYLGKDLKLTRGPLIVDMMEKADSVDFCKTESVLDALILEGNLIQKHQPYYNTDAKDDKSFNYVVITREDFPQIRLVRERGFHKNPEHSLGGLSARYVFGPYPHGLQLKEAMKIIRQIFPYRDEKCTPAPEQIRRGRTPRPCFNRQIGLCPGVCTGEVNKKEYARIVNHLRLFFEGKKGKLIKQLEKEMKRYAKNQEFEKAAEIRKTIYALGHIQDVSLIKSPHEPEEIVPDRPFRMEAYDVAHTGGKDTTGVMVVSENKEIKKTDYRMFKIRGDKGINDIAALKETLERRFKHSEWPWPDVAVLDGSTAQLNVAKEIFQQVDYPIKAVAVVKDAGHRPERIIGDEKIAQEYHKEILELNGEAHRFTIKYHKKLRRQSFL
jgi:excinuclease ABC subunit C